MITLLYRVVGYATLVIWGFLLYSIISWKFNLHSFERLKNIGGDIDKKNKFEKILKVINYILYFLRFSMILESLDILLMAIGIFNSARLPYKGIILASSISSYFLFLFFQYLFKSALNNANK